MIIINTLNSKNIGGFLLCVYKSELSWLKNKKENYLNIYYDFAMKNLSQSWKL
jgi:hypothetical protein